ncbi:protein phosphatase 1L [Neocloeon triangulifer]|uniref:protein phosphatase 1L n=1 Tax=Neocloeon triangulifer TaxID=2078957 RepID=UPI00286FA200|nr:protein phosphatase 1L [Neocloeon triangulifer]XP_059480771.1 protein phosphatase 1L [Neocloeon triangulifer]
MEDSLEDEILYQTYMVHMNKFAFVLPLLPQRLPTLNYALRLLRLYLLKPEVFVVTLVSVVLIVYLQTANNLWARPVIARLQNGLAKSNLSCPRLGPGKTIRGNDSSWCSEGQKAAVFAIQGRRPHMEDRFVLAENFEESGVSFFAVFDGHGGDFAANFASDRMSSSIQAKILEAKEFGKKGIEKKQANEAAPEDEKPKGSPPESPPASKPKDKMVYDDMVFGSDKQKINSILLQEIVNKRNGQIGIPPVRKAAPRKAGEASDYISNGQVNYDKLLTDEILLADEQLVAKAKSLFDIAGSTALMAIVEGKRLIVANVGDSRGVMCDHKGNAIPLSFDHKPQQTKERQRIMQAGGLVTFNGVWRVAGILATSRALGDYPLKERNLVVAEPDILTFDLSDHRPQFIILASDGLWDTFSNEEAVTFIKERISEPFYGAKSITLQAFHKGSLDNITVLVVCFNGHLWA